MNSENPPIAPGALPDAATLSVLAVASLVLGILGFCSGGLAGIIGLILGISALVIISGSNGRKRGTGFAVAGIVCSVISFLTIFFLIGLLLPGLSGLSRAREAARGTMALGNAKMIAIAINTYAVDHADDFPPVDDWADVLLEQNYITKDALIWPSEPDDGRCFAMNSRLDGMKTSAVSDPTRTILFFEVGAGSPLAGGEELLDFEPRYRGGYAIVFVDGHAEFVAADELENYTWEPN